MMPAAQQEPRRGQRGMTLVELMVAMAIGLVIAAGLAVLFADSSRSNRELEGTSRQIESGRYAVDLLAQELAVAGFYGEVDKVGAAYTSPDPCSAVLTSLGWDSSSKSRPSPMEGKNATELASHACASHPASGNPGLLLRRLDAAVSPQASINNADGFVYVQTSQCNADPANIPFIVSNDKSALTLRNLACTGTGTGEVRRYLSRLYYVAACNECSGSAADTIPTLKRAELIGDAVVVTPLATGIERLALEYGFDTNLDGIPDVYRTGLSGVSGAAENAWTNVVTVRLYVLARTTEETKDGIVDSKRYELGLSGTFGPYNDRYKRKVFVTTAKLQNVAGPREQ